MFRLYFSIFWNKQTDVHGHHSEGTFSMKLPLILLAICTLAAGFIPFGEFVSADGKPLESHFNLSFSIAPVVLGLAGILVAMLMYKKENNKPQQVASALGGLYRSAYKKFYIDELYLFITKKIVFNFIGRPAAWIDKNIVDGLMNGIASVTGKISALIKNLQSGKIQNYTLYFFGGLAAFLIIFIYFWKP